MLGFFNMENSGRLAKGGGTLSSCLQVYVEMEENLLLQGARKAVLTSSKTWSASEQDLVYVRELLPCSS